MNERADFGARLRAAMQHQGYPLRPVVLEREFNTRYWGRSVTLQAARRWLRGEAIPAQDKLQVLAEWLGMPPEELRFGVVVRQSVQERQARWDLALDHREREVIDTYLGLPAEQRKVVREVILAMACASAAKKADAAQQRARDAGR